MRLTRRELTMLGLGLAAPRIARAEAPYPDGPVTMVVPFAAGGSTHMVSRLLTDRLSRSLGQRFAVESRVGLSGTLGTASVARAAPDGRTLLVSPNSTFAMAANLHPISYDNERDLVPISLIATNALALCVHGASGLQRLEDLVAAARTAPGQLRYGSAGTGVSNHLAAELFEEAFEIDLTHVLFNGGGPAAQAVIADRVQLSFVDLVTAIPLIRGGALRALAVTAEARVPQLPEVPTIAELGGRDYRATTDFMLFAHAATPEPILARLSAATISAMRSIEVRDRLEPLAIQPIGGTREEAQAYFLNELTRWGTLIRHRAIQAS